MLLLVVASRGILTMVFIRIARLALPFAISVQATHSIVMNVATTALSKVMHVFAMKNLYLIVKGIFAILVRINVRLVLMIL